MRFWAVFSPGKIRDNSVIPAIRALIEDPAVVIGWGTVGAEARAVLSTITGD